MRPRAGSPRGDKEPVEPARMGGATWRSAAKSILGCFIALALAGVGLALLVFFFVRPAATFEVAASLPAAVALRDSADPGDPVFESACPSDHFSNSVDIDNSAAEAASRWLAVDHPACPTPPTVRHPRPDRAGSDYGRSRAADGPWYAGGPASQLRGDRRGQVQTGSAVGRATLQPGLPGGPARSVTDPPSGPGSRAAGQHDRVPPPPSREGVHGPSTTGASWTRAQGVKVAPEKTFRTAQPWPTFRPLGAAQSWVPLPRPRWRFHTRSPLGMTA